MALRVWDDHRKKDFLKCKNIRFQNNLVLAPQAEADLVFNDHHRGSGDYLPQADLESLGNSREWRFSHNWREIDAKTAAARFPGRWIPCCSNDKLQVPITVLSRALGHPNFLQPAKDSLLATGGAGVKDSALPAYVGAVAPEGAEPWDWDRTWKAPAHYAPDSP
jgi:hypothetical protein